MLFHPLTITAVTRETPSAVALSFAVPDALRPVFAFHPGQYLTLRTTRAGQEIRRPYSICSTPADAQLSVGIKQVDGGLFSTYANTALAAGDTLDVMPPEGRFGLTPDPATARHLLAIAAGSGITPILSILRATLDTEPESRATLLYGSRSTAEIMFRSALEDLKDRHLDRLTIAHVLSREAQDLAVLHGRLDAGRIAALLPTTAIDDAFLCGPEALIQTAETVLAGRCRIHAERFTPAPRTAPRPPRTVAAEPPAATATIIFDGKTNTIAVPPGEPILEAALAAGLDLPWSCRGGMCCTCRARLTEGAASMTANFSLEDWETAAGFVLTCQAHPTTPHVTVDCDQL